MGDPIRFLRAAPVLASLDLDKTESFYKERLGFETEFKYPNYLSVIRNGLAIHFWVTDDPAIPKATSCYVYLEGVDALHAEYDAAGVVHPNGQLGTRPWRMKEFAILDGDGNMIRFGENLKPA